MGGRIDELEKSLSDLMTQVRCSVGLMIMLMMLGWSG
jgi:hypothetical protein